MRQVIVLQKPLLLPKPLHRPSFILNAVIYLYTGGLDCLGGLFQPYWFYENAGLIQHAEGVAVVDCTKCKAAFLSIKEVTTSTGIHVFSLGHSQACSSLWERSIFIFQGEGGKSTHIYPISNNISLSDIHLVWQKRKRTWSAFPSNARVFSTDASSHHSRVPLSVNVGMHQVIMLAGQHRGGHSCCLWAPLEYCPSYNH